MTDRLDTEREAVRKAEFEGTVVIMAANSWDGIRMADRQLAESLCRHAPVLYVDPPSVTHLVLTLEHR